MLSGLLPYCLELSMTAFCVFGMTEPLAKKAATRASETWVARMSEQERKELSKAEIEEWIEVKTADIMRAGRSVQVPSAFDAPQFAKDWIDLAQRTVKTRSLTVMVRGEKIDKHGAPVISKKTKKPVIGWINYR
ncbi:hypothetical protein L512_5223 [Bordetella bronchiseptica MBORD624]|uniref:hypothetical protein n=1 Tax=Bordetella bronchiseptica TaxID=518 RepID=UPI0004617160|nr:hypothetical protein [Bordetella bronchiseptica]KDC59430.1 hypothetical protein L511_4154 [Bordetella bronchiseptica MBORD595]KDC67993.1 hypothetical protein L512_5223 [Bordetella bronchiseptica MBORD624]